MKHHLVEDVHDLTNKFIVLLSGCKKKKKQKTPTPLDENSRKRRKDFPGRDCILSPTIEQLYKSWNDARLGQHGGAGVVHGDRADHYHHLQHQVIFCGAWRSEMKATRLALAWRKPVCETRCDRNRDGVICVNINTLTRREWLTRFEVVFEEGY